MSAFTERNAAVEDRARELFARTARIKGCVAWLWHVPGNKVYFSEEWRHVLLCPEDPLLEHCVSRWWPERVHEDDIVPFLEAARDIVEGLTDTYQTLFRVRRGDGTWAWLLSRGTVTDREEGKPLYVTGTMMDVSCLRADVKFQHGGLASGMAGRQAMFDNSPDLIVRLDQELFPLYVNPAISRYIARRHNEVDGSDNAGDLGLDAEYLAFLQKNVSRVFREGAPIRESVSFATAYGHEVTGEYSFWPECDADGKVVAVMTQFRDITDQILAERHARLNETRLDALYRLTLMDDAPKEELLRFVVDKMVEISGSESGFLVFPGEEPVRNMRIVWSKDLYDKLEIRWLPDMATPDELTELIGGEREATVTRMIRNGNNLQPVCHSFGGRLKVLRFLAAPVLDQGQVVCVSWVCNKHTEYRESDLQQLEAFINGAWFILRRHDFVRKLRQAKEQAEAATTAMSEFLVNVNHELRTPLTSILGYAETLIQLGPDEESFRNRCIEVIRLQAGQMHKLVLALLNLSRIEGALQLNLAPLDLEELADETVESLQKTLREKQLRVSLSLPPGLRVRADSHFLAQVFRNLIENAATYADSGTEISVRAELRGDEAVISVEDQGVLIPVQDLDRIFERFYRGKPAVPERTVLGTGVGLPICKQVIQRHGGRIWAENTPRGVKVSFTLPL